MKLVFKQYLLKATIILLAMFIAINTYKGLTNNHELEQIKIVQQDKQIADSEYTISEKMIMNKLQSKSQIVSLQQDLHKKDTKVDDFWLGERRTTLEINGTVKMGLETKDIDIRHIDSQSGIIYVKLPKPILISLEVPYDSIKFDKTQGFFRMALDEKEEKNFYRSVLHNVKKELMSDKELMKQSNLYNQDAVREILKMIPEVKTVVFE